MRTLYQICIFLALTAILGMLLGCPKDDAGRVDAPPAKPPIEAGLPELEKPKAGKDGKVDELEQARYEARKYAELSAQATARYEVLSKQRAEEALQAQVMWISGIALIIAAIAGVAAFLVPIGKKSLVAIAVGCVVIAACAQAFRAAVPYLPWVGGALLVGGGIWVAINWRKLGAAVQSAADHGDRLEDWLTSDVLPHLDDAGRALVEKTLAGVKQESQQQAQRLGTHGVVQYLRGKAPSLLQRMLNRP